MVTLSSPGGCVPRQTLLVRRSQSATARYVPNFAGLARAGVSPEFWVKWALSPAFHCEGCLSFQRSSLWLTAASLYIVGRNVLVAAPALSLIQCLPEPRDRKAHGGNRKCRHSEDVRLQILESGALQHDPTYDAQIMGQR